MAQSHAVMGSVQQTLQQNVDEAVPLKRKKKDSGAPAGKNVVVLKSCDVTIGHNYVRMPNTIEMAQLKKKEKGQFVTNVQISSKMTQQDIRELLIRLFPYLGDQSFYCASAVENRTRLDFHGERRIWDGHLIKQKIKGNSALYIFTDEGSLRSKEDSSTHLKQSTLKRSHDQMTLTMTNRCRIDKDDTTIMAQGGIHAQSGMTQTIVSTTSDSQTRQHAMHIADGHADTRNTISSESSLLPHADLQSILSSSVTPQLNSLSIASADSEQERYQLCQTTSGGYDLAHIHLDARKRQEQGNGTATRVQGITCNSNTEVQLGAGKRGSVSNAAGTHQEDSGSDFESQSSDSAVERPSDSGIEGSDNLFADDTVQEIRPDSGSVKGGIGFYIALTEALPEEVKEGVAQFQGVADVTVEKKNPFMLAGTVPPSQLAGQVTVKVTVKNDSDVYIGFTFFTYKDEMSDIVEEIVKDRALQSRFFAKYSRELAKENLANDGKQTEAQGQLPHPDSSVETKQNQSIELLQLLDYNAAKRDFRWFIEMVTSAGQDIFNCYKDRTPWPENVARAHGNVELAPLQDVHPSLSLNKNVSSTILYWLDLDEAVHKHLATLESPIRVDLSDDDDDDSSDYFADAETSSCGSFDDDIGWSEIFENKEPCVHDEISNEVQNIREYDDLPITVSSRASFTKNERIIGKSTNGQITSEDISFAGKQSSSGLNKEEKGEFSELLKFMRTTHVPGLPTLSCDDPGEENIISTKLNLVKPKASEIKNERATEEETTQGQTTCDVINLWLSEILERRPRPLVRSFIGTYKVTRACSDLLTSLVQFEFRKDRPANERLRDAVNAIYDAKTKGVWKCLAREFRVSEMTWIDPVVNKWKLRYWNIERETLFSHLTLLMKEQHLLEREQLFAVEQWLAQKLSTKTEQLLNVRLMKRERKFQGTYEVSGDPVCKSVNSYEGEPKEVALAIPFELFLDPVATQTCLESNVGVRNSKINQTDKGNQQVDKNDCKALKLCKAGRGTQVTYEAVQTSLHVNFVQLEYLTVGCRVVLQTKPLESNLRKTDEITMERLFDLSCDLRKEWKNLALVLGVRDLTNDLVDETNQKLREKCYNMLLLWKQRFGPQATYKELAVGLCHESVQREDLVKKYCQDIISSAMQ